MGPLQLRGAQRERASILGHVSKRAREHASKKTCAREVREQNEVRARGARAKRGARARCASEAREQKRWRAGGTRAMPAATQARARVHPADARTRSNKFIARQ